MFMKNSVNSSLVHRQAVCNLPGGYSTILPHKGIHCSNWFLSDDHMCLTWSWHVRCTHTPMTKITTPSENCSTWHTLRTKEHLTSVTSKENCQPEYNVLRAHTASFKKLLLQLTWTGCRHSTLRLGLWAVCEVLVHTIDALQCKHVPVFFETSGVRTGPLVTDPTVWRSGRQTNAWQALRLALQGFLVTEWALQRTETSLIEQCRVLGCGAAVAMQNLDDACEEHGERVRQVS
jgi:hypothetical protein